MKPRTLSTVIQKAVKTFPVVVVTGPRQSGKTTLLKNLFSKSHSFVSLEDPDTRIRAKDDPIGFLENNKPPVIFDEIQYVPELLPYIKSAIDTKRTAGQWLLTGSQNFSLMQGVTESLAGRAAILTLLPFSFFEQEGYGDTALSFTSFFKKLKIPTHTQRKNKTPLYELLLRGQYPEIATKKTVDRELWCGSYISTYLERDVRNLANIGDFHQFERFLKLCATRTGQILNLTDIARDIGVSVPTTKRWLSVLEVSHQIFLLYPYYENLGKRIIKSPKLYFGDTGLVTYLLGIHNKETLLKSPQFGSILETFIIIDFLKRYRHLGKMPSMYYVRTQDGLEVDLVLEHRQKLHLFEIKSAATIFPRHAQSLLRLKKDIPHKVETLNIISLSKESFSLTKGVINHSWKDIL